MNGSKRRKTNRTSFAISSTGLVSCAFALCLLLASPAPALCEEQHAARLRAGVFLFAIPELRDPNFSQTVVLLVDYSAEGAMGLIINRPTEIPLEKALPDVPGIEKQAPLLYFGGPVGRNRMLVLMRSDKPIEGSEKVFRDVYFTTSKEILEKILPQQNSQKKVRVYAGYAGWAPGQLDHEVSRGDWKIGNADAEMIFSEDPSKAWHEIFKIQEQIEIRVPDAILVPDKKGPERL